MPLPRCRHGHRQSRACCAGGPASAGRPRASTPPLCCSSSRCRARRRGLAASRPGRRSRRPSTAEMLRALCVVRGGACERRPRPCVTGSERQPTARERRPRGRAPRRRRRASRARGSARTARSPSRCSSGLRSGSEVAVGVHAGATVDGARSAVGGELPRPRGGPARARTHLDRARRAAADALVARLARRRSRLLRGRGAAAAATARSSHRRPRPTQTAGDRGVRRSSSASRARRSACGWAPRTSPARASTRRTGGRTLYVRRRERSSRSAVRPARASDAARGAATPLTFDRSGRPIDLVVLRFGASDGGSRTCPSASRPVAGAARRPPVAARAARAATEEPPRPRPTGATSRAARDFLDQVVTRRARGSGTPSTSPRRCGAARRRGGSSTRAPTTSTRRASALTGSVAAGVELGGVLGAHGDVHATSLRCGDPRARRRLACARPNACAESECCRPPRPCEHVFVAVRRAPLPLRLLVPRRGLAARRAGGRRAASAGTRRSRSPTTTRSRARWSSRRRPGALGLRADPRGGGDGVRFRGGRGRPHAHLTLLVRDAPRLGQPLPAAHARARAHAGIRPRPPRSGPPGRGPAARARLEDAHVTRRGLAERHARGRRGPRRGPRLPQRLRAPGRARRADDAPRCCAPSGATRFRVELQRPFHRHDRALNRGAGGARRSPRGAVRGHRQRPRPHARARAAAGRVRGHPRAHDARRLRAAAPRQPRHVLATPEAMAARFADHPDAVAETARLADTLPFDLTSDLGYRYPGAEDDAGRRDAGRGLPRVLRVALPARAPAARRGRRAPRGGAARSSRELGLSGFFLLHREMLELAREVAVEVRGAADTAPRALLPPGRGRGSSVSSIVCYLTGLSHVDPIANKPPARALPQRGDHDAARHRPRLPARRARGPDPARARALRARPLGARRRLPDLSRARRHPRDRQGARACRRGRSSASRAARRAGRRRASTATSPRRWATTPGRRSPWHEHNRWRWLAGCPTRPTACRATSPSTPGA